jgi:molybdopterin adenylyltransferase
MSTVPEQHRSEGKGLCLSCAVLTCSDSRTEIDDHSGSLIRSLLTDAGHEVVSYQIVREDPGYVTDALHKAAGVSRVILVNGGTGVSPRDGTVEAVQDFIEVTLPGFGELFRSLSFAEIGAAAMLSRAVGGIGRGVLVFAMPGSTAAVRLAMNQLIVPELRHLAQLLAPDGD